MRSGQHHDKLRALIRKWGAGFVILSVYPLTIWAGPTGSRVMHGSADIVHQGDYTTIFQHTDQAILQHSSFDIGAGQTVEFVQPSSGATALNHILSAAPTTIDGQLLANGRVFLINPAGVLFGESAYVNATQLVASALNLNHQDFLSGNFHFQGGEGSVVNTGHIETRESTALIGKQVRNLGHIECSHGVALLAAGDDVYMSESGSYVTVALDSDKLVSSPEPTGTEAAVVNEGTIVAPGGEIALAGAGDVMGMAILNSGRLSTSNETDAGRITLDAPEGNVVHQGSIDALSDTGQGGQVQITGERVGLLESAQVDVSGATGAGEILVGGDYQGQGDTPTATRTVVDEQTSIRADALESGDGGKVIVWSDETTYFAGSISARGGDYGGDGGLVEVSGKENLGFFGDVDTKAPQGETGNLLLDPTNIVVGEGGNDRAPGGQILFDDAPPADWAVSFSEIQTQYYDNNLTLEAHRDITFDYPLTLTTLASGGHTTTVRAGRSITLNENITTDGSISMVANHPSADDGIRGTGAAAITMADGTSISSSGNIELQIDSRSGSTNNTSGDITLGSLTSSSGHVLVQNEGPTAGSDILVASGSSNGIISALSTALDVSGAGGGGAVGTSSNPFRVDGAVEARAQSGGVYLYNGASETRVANATLGNLAGVSTTGGGDINLGGSEGPVRLSENVTTAGGGNINISDNGRGLTIEDNRDVTLSTGSEGGNITIAGNTNGTSISEGDSGDESLALDAGTGDVSMGGVFGYSNEPSAGGLTTLTVDAANVSLNQVNVTGALSVTNSGTVTLASDITTDNSNIGFTGAVTTSGPVTMTAGTGNVSLAGAVDIGSNDLTIASSGEVDLSGGITGTSGNVILGTSGQSLSLGGDVTVDAGTGDVRVRGALEDDGDSQTSSDVVINTSGDTRFLQAVGATTPIESLTTGGGGTTYLWSDVTTAGGTQTYNDALFLNGLSGGTLTDTGTTGITFNATVNAQYEGATSLTVVTTNSQAEIAFNGDVGTVGIRNLTVTNAGLLDIAPDADMTLGGAFLQNGSGAVQTAGDITTGNDGNVDFQSVVTLTDAHTVALNSSAGDGGGNIHFHSTLDGTTAHAENLTLDAGLGDVTFSGVVGGSVALGDVDVTSASNVVVAAAFSADDITFSAFSGSTIDIDDDVVAGGSITLNDNTTVASGKGLTAGTNIQLGTGYTITGEGSLSLDADGGGISATDGVVDIDMPVDGSTLTLTQLNSLDLDTFQVTNDEDTLLVFNSTGGDVSGTSAGRWRSLQGTAVGNIDLLESSSGEPDVRLGGAVTSSGGGVRLRSDLGQVYTYGNADSAINGVITGTSDQGSQSETGVDLDNSSEFPGKGAVVIRSGGNLTVGPSAVITANGSYYGSSEDDRTALDFSGGSPFDAAMLLAAPRVTIDPAATLNIPANAAYAIDSTSGTNLGSPPTQPWIGLDDITNTQRLEIAVRDASSLGSTSQQIPYASNVAGGVSPEGMLAGSYVLRGQSSASVLGSVEGGTILLPPPIPYPGDVFDIIELDSGSEGISSSGYSGSSVVMGTLLPQRWAALLASAEEILGQPLKIPHIECVDDVNEIRKQACVELDSLWASDVDAIAPVFIERVAHRIVDLYSQLARDFDSSQEELRLVASSWQQLLERAQNEQGLDVAREVEKLIQANKNSEKWLDAAVRFARTLYQQQGFTIDGSVQKIQETCVADAEVKGLVNAYIRFKLMS